MRHKRLSQEERNRRAARRARREEARAAAQVAAQAAYEARWAGATCEFCENVIEFLNGRVFCRTCDLIMGLDSDGDGFIEKPCTAMRPAPNGDHQQTCDHPNGHDGPHAWRCDAPKVDEKGGEARCYLDADDPHDAGHAWMPIRPPRCKALARTAPHGIVVRCLLERDHEGHHHTHGGYGYDHEMVKYDARWIGDEMSTIPVVAAPLGM